MVLGCVPALARAWARGTLRRIWAAVKALFVARYACACMGLGAAQRARVRTTAHHRASGFCDKLCTVVCQRVGAE